MEKVRQIIRQTSLTILMMNRILMWHVKHFGHFRAILLYMTYPFAFILAIVTSSITVLRDPRKVTMVHGMKPCMIRYQFKFARGKTNIEVEVKKWIKKLKQKWKSLYLEKYIKNSKKLLM